MCHLINIRVLSCTVTFLEKAILCTICVLHFLLCERVIYSLICECVKLLFIADKQCLFSSVLYKKIARLRGSASCCLSK